MDSQQIIFLRPHSRHALKVGRVQEHMTRATGTTAAAVAERVDLIDPAVHQHLFDRQARGSVNRAPRARAHYHVYTRHCRQPSMEDSFRNAAPPHGKLPFTPRDTIFVRHLSMWHNIAQHGVQGKPLPLMSRYPLQRRVHEPVNEPIGIDQRRGRRLIQGVSMFRSQCYTHRRKILLELRDLRGPQ